MQPHYNLIYREEEREMIPFCQDQKIAVIPWSPLARGLLTGNRSKERNETMRARTDEFGKRLYYSDSDFDIVNRLTEIATKRSAGCPGSTCMDAEQTCYYCSDYRSKQTRASGRCCCCLICKIDSKMKSLSLEELYQPHPVLGHV